MSSSTTKELKNKLVEFDSSDYCSRCHPMTTVQINCIQGNYFEKESEQVDILFVTDGITKEDIYYGQVLSGGLRAIIRRWLVEAKLDKKVVYLDTLTRCSLGSGDIRFQKTVDRKKIVRNCEPYLYREIERLKPKLVIPLGYIALQSILNQSDIAEWSGKIVKSPALNCYVMPLIHPRDVAHNSENIVRSLIKAKEVLNKKISFVQPKHVFVRNEIQADKMFLKLQTASKVVIDIETQGINHRDGKIIGVSFSIDSKTGWFFPFMDFDLNSSDQFPEGRWIKDKESNLYKKYKKKIKSVIESKKSLKIIHNLSFEYKWFREYGFILPYGYTYDTLVVNDVLNDLGNGLKTLVQYYTDFGGYESDLDFYLSNQKGKSKDYSDIPPLPLAKYGVYDTVGTFIVYENQLKEAKNHSVKNLIPELNKTRYNLCEIEYAGISIDLKKSQELKNKYEKQIVELEKEIRKTSGVKDLNPSSPTQLVKVLYDRDFLKPIYKYVKDRSLKKKLESESTDKQTISKVIKIAESIPKVKGVKELLKFCKALSNHRKVAKLKSTYIDTFLEKSILGKIYTSFNMGTTAGSDESGVATGRLSSSNPNFQNIPRDSDIRECVVVPKGYTLYEFDYSQLEVRIAAEYSQDLPWIDRLNSGQDTHVYNGVNILVKYKIPKPNGKLYLPKEFESDYSDPEPRVKAKIIGFSVIYGKTGYGLSADLGVTVPVAEQVIQAIFNEHPGLKNWVNNQKQFVRQNGYINTLFGRKIKIPDFDSQDDFRIAEAFRKAVNYPVQSSASDVVTHALNRVCGYLRAKKLKTYPVLTVHDSIMFAVHNSETKFVPKQIKKLMESKIPQVQKVKLVVDCKTGSSWGTAKKIKF
jgi:DNA polymerase-1